MDLYKHNGLIKRIGLIKSIGLVTKGLIKVIGFNWDSLLCVNQALNLKNIGGIYARLRQKRLSDLPE